MTRTQAICIARGLLEPGEESNNPEYTRALIEFINDAYGPDREIIARELGTTVDVIYNRITRGLKHD